MGRRRPDDEPENGLSVVAADFAGPAAPAPLVREAVTAAGPLDALVVNHARSQLGSLGTLDHHTLDLMWRVNVRVALLLVQAFVEQYEMVRTGDPGPTGTGWATSEEVAIR